MYLLASVSPYARQPLASPAGDTTPESVSAVAMGHLSGELR